MARAPADDAIDTLYQRPLDEFTAARNALAKETGDASIKKLEKPNLAAWAVNQLYWHQRKLYDEVIKTSAQVRTAYRQMLAGKSADVRAAEVFHSEAMRKAKDAIRAILAAAGNNASDALMTPVNETLDALPTTDPPGRLTKPLRRTGFEALQGVTIAAKPSKPITPKTETSRSLLLARPIGNARSERPISRSSRWRRSACGSRKRPSAKRQPHSIARSERWSGPSARASGSKASSQRRRSPRRRARKELSTSESAYEKAKAESDRLRRKIG